MKIKGVSEEQIKSIAAELGFRCDNPRTEGRYFLFVLRMETPTPSVSERKWLDKHDTVRLGSADDKKYRSIARRLQYRKRGSDLKRWTGAVCFHGHKVFMDAIFRANPDARIVTTMARYEDRADFERKWVSTGMAKGGVATTGPAYAGLQYREMCDCYGG